MAALVVSLSSLPADLAITARSRKFYDGTYKWDSDGFTDEHGGKCILTVTTLSLTHIVYREYDCLDPLARAPTPLPPMLLDDEDDMQIDVATIEPAQSHTPTECVVVETDTPCTKPDNAAVTDEAPRTPGSIRRFAINLLSKPRQAKPAIQSEAAVDSQIVEDAIDRPEEFEPGSEPGEIVEVLHRSYEVCGDPNSTKRERGSMKMPETPPTSPPKTTSVPQTISPTSTISTLSPVPSTLSEQDTDEDIKASSPSQQAYPTNIHRLKVSQQPSIFRASTARHPRPRLQGRKAQRPAASPRWSARAPRNRQLESSARRSEKTTASSRLRCWNCIRDRICARAALGSLLDRRSCMGNKGRAEI